ncbi:MAG: hypothetical protein J6W96_00370 [Alphaproteobacteria bacterium]|nr:hypothetical protein [Alphaproteobacteria bacterium]
MSEKAIKTKQERPASKVLKVILTVLLIFILEIVAIVSSVKISDFRGQNEDIRLQQIKTRIAEQNTRIESLEGLSAAISTNSKQLTTTTNGLNVLSEKIDNLEKLVGGNKFEKIVNEVSLLNHKVSSLEELKNNEALILSITLIIKENILHHKSFAKETEILTEMSKDIAVIQQDVNTLNLYKNSNISDDDTIIKQFNIIADNFSFDKAIENPKEAKDDLVSKSIKMVKDTMSGMHFDKVVVLKKEKLTDQQEILISTLKDLVNSYNYTDALEFIAQNQELANMQNNDFTNWQEAVKQKIAVDQAISHITASQLKALRQDFKEIEKAKPQEVVPEKGMDSAITEENEVND